MPHGVEQPGHAERGEFAVSVGWSQLVGTNDCAARLNSSRGAHGAQHLDQRALVEEIRLVEPDPIAKVRDPLERLRLERRTMPCTS